MRSRSVVALLLLLALASRAASQNARAKSGRALPLPRTARRTRGGRERAAIADIGPGPRADFLEQPVDDAALIEDTDTPAVRAAHACASPALLARSS
jgi:hypothetical protein